MSARLRLMPPPNSPEPEQVMPLPEFLERFHASPFAGQANVIPKIRVLRFLTEPPERGGLRNRRVSPRAMEAILGGL